MNSDVNRTKREASEKLIDVFFKACRIGFPLIGVWVLVALAVPLCVAALPEKVLTAKLTFTSLGLLFGIFQVFLGVLLALVGVTIDYDVDATMGPAKIKLASASPGILLLIVGNLLFAFSLMREFEVSESTKHNLPESNISTEAGNSNVGEDDPLRGVGGPE